MDSISELSKAASAVSAEASKRLFHVPSPAGGRTALSFDGKRLIVPAMQAEEGERVPVLVPGGAERGSRVVGFDSRQGLAILELDEAIPSAAWKAAAVMPALGSIVLTLAFPSPDGPEAKLGLVRIAKGSPDDEAAYIQTDSPPFPGFAGGAIISVEGQLLAVVVSDRGGNRSWALPAKRAAALAESIAATGFPRRAWLGISSIPVDLPAELKAKAGKSEALMIAGLAENGPAAKAGVLPGDIILSVGAVSVARPEELREAIEAATVGKPVVVEVLRGGTKHSISVETVAAPQEDWGGPRPGGHHHHGHHHGPHHGHGGQGWHHHHGEGPGDQGEGPGHHGGGHRGHHHGGDCDCGGGDCGCSTGR